MRQSNGVGPVVMLTVAAAGPHMLNLWMNRANVKVDEVVLTTSSTFRPDTEPLPPYAARFIDLPPVPAETSSVDGAGVCPATP